MSLLTTVTIIIYMFLTPFLPRHAGSEAPWHGRTQKFPNLPFQCLTPSTPAQLLHRSRVAESSFTASHGPGATDSPPAAPKDTQDPRHHGHVKVLPTTLHHTFLPLSQGGWRPASKGYSRVWKAPWLEKQCGKREAGEGEEVKWWENLEAGQGVTLK